MNNEEEMKEENLKMDSENQNLNVNPNLENTKDLDKKNEKSTKEEVKKDSKKQKIYNVIFHIVAIVCISLFSAAISPKTLQNDTYYTITIGEYIYENGISDLTKDMYSSHDLPYTYPHWLYDLCIFLVYNVFGHEGIYVSTMILSAILGISIYALSNKKSNNKIISWIVTIGAMYLLKGFIAARAQLVTFILFAWAVYCIESFLETKKKKYAFCLFLIPLLIANLHCAVFPFYLVLFMPYIAEYLLLVFEDANWDLKVYSKLLKIRRKFTKKEESFQKIDAKLEKLEYYKMKRDSKVKELREKPYKVIVKKNHVVLLLISIMALSGFTGFFNPAGDGAYTYLYKTMQGNSTESINEHLPLTLLDNTEFTIAIFLFLLVLIFTDTKIKLSDLFMLTGMTFLSFFSRRQVSMFAIFCAPILAALLAQMFEKNNKQLFIKLERFVSDWFGAIVVTCLFVIGCTHIIKPTLQSEFVDTSSYPVQAADWILMNLDVENIKLYNEYNYGSYLLHRGIPVFIDSRCDLYTPEFNGTYNPETKEYENSRDIFSDALNIPSLSVNYEDMFAKYGVTHVMLYSNAKLAMILEEDPDYNRIYSQGNFKIFERLNANVENDDDL